MDGETKRWFLSHLELSAAADRHTNKRMKTHAQANQSFVLLFCFILICSPLFPTLSMLHQPPSSFFASFSSYRPRSWGCCCTPSVICYILSYMACYQPAPVVMIKTQSREDNIEGWVRKGYQQTPATSISHLPNRTIINKRTSSSSLPPSLPFLYFSIIPKSHYSLTKKKDLIGFDRLYAGQLYHFKGVMVRRGQGRVEIPPRRKDTWGSSAVNDISSHFSCACYCLITAVVARVLLLACDHHL